MPPYGVIDYGIADMGVSSPKFRKGLSDIEQVHVCGSLNNAYGANDEDAFIPCNLARLFFIK